MSIPSAPPLPPPPPAPAGRELAVTPQQAGRALESLKILLRRGHVNLAEFQARLYETEMVDLLANFARDPLLDAGFRRDCAKDVLDRARGKPMVAARLEMPETNVIDGDDPMGRDVIEAQTAADDMGEFQRWLARPLDQWPAEVLARYSSDVKLLQAG